MNLWSEINEKGTAILLVTHDAKIAAKAEKILFMKDGNIHSWLELNENRDMNHRVDRVIQQMQAVEIYFFCGVVIWHIPLRFDISANNKDEKLRWVMI